MANKQDVMSKISKVLSTTSPSMAKSIRRGYDAFTGEGEAAAYSFDRPTIAADVAYWEVYPEIDFVPPSTYSKFRGSGSLESEESRAVAPVQVGNRFIKKGLQVDEQELKAAILEYASIGIQFRLFEPTTGKIVNYVDGYRMSERFKPFYIHIEQMQAIDALLKEYGLSWEGNIELLELLAARGKPRLVSQYVDAVPLSSEEEVREAVFANKLETNLTEVLSRVKSKADRLIADAGTETL